MSLTYFWVFIFLMAAGMPVVFALLIGPGVSLVADGQEVFLKALLSRLYNGMDSFPLMAVPFFILAGEVMNSGGITRSIVQFSQSMIGHVRGGLAQMNILSSLLFAAMAYAVPPNTDAGPDQSVDEQSNVQLDGSGSSASSTEGFFAIGASSTQPSGASHCVLRVT